VCVYCICLCGCVHVHVRVCVWVVKHLKECQTFTYCLSSKGIAMSCGVGWGRLIHMPALEMMASG
jgi:hypothetical protein